MGSAELTLEDHLGGRGLGARRHVAVKEGRGRHVDAPEEVGALDDDRLEIFLDGARARDGGGLPHEDAGDVVGVAGEVAAAAAERGDAAQERPVDVGAQADGAHRDPLGAHRLGQLRDPLLGRLPVGQHDDVLDARAGHGEVLVRHVDRREDAGAAPRREAPDVAEDAHPVARALHAHDALGRGVETDDLDVIVRAEELRGGRSGLLGELHLLSVHRAALVDDQREAEGGLITPSLRVHAHRQEALHARPLPAAEPEGVLAAGHQEAAAHVPHVALDGVHLGERDLVGRDVAQDEEVEALELAQGRRDRARAADVDFEVPRGQRLRQIGAAAARALDVEDRGPAGDHHRALERVVRGEAVVAAWLDRERDR